MLDGIARIRRASAGGRGAAQLLRWLERHGRTACGPSWLRLAAPLAIALHKAPEGIALGGILCASMKSRGWAFTWAALAEGTTMAGGAFGLWLAPQFGAKWVAYPLGLTAGWLCYLGFHAAHEEWKRRGARRAFTAAAAGMAGAALILRGAEAFLH